MIDLELKEFAQKYFDLIFGKYAGLNLTAIEDFDVFYAKQVLDSALPALDETVLKSAILEYQNIVDVGFGGGFPLLVLAKLYPQKRFIGLEARSKKVKAVQDIAQILGLNNVHCYHQRIETLMIDIPCLITFKAVGKAQDFLKMIQTNKKIVVSFYKSKSFENDELPYLKSLSKQWSILGIDEICLDGADKRIIVNFTNKNVPHGTNKTLVNLSALTKN
jgi:16S rRNA (guanine527-N7)-methyltransferase